MNGNKPSRIAFRVKKLYTGQNLLSRTNLYPKNVSAFAEITFETFWSITSEYPELVPKRNLQLRLIGNLGLQSGIPWLRIKSEDKCLLCGIQEEDMIHFALRFPYFFNDWKSF